MSPGVYNFTGEFEIWELFKPVNLQSRDPEGFIPLPGTGVPLRTTHGSGYQDHTSEDITRSSGFATS